MMKKGILLLLFLGISVPTFAGWLSDAVSGAIEKVGERAVGEATDGAYEGLKQKAGKAIEAPPDQSPETESKEKPESEEKPDATVNQPVASPPPDDVRTQSTPRKKKASTSTIDLPHFSGRLLSFDPEDGEAVVMIYAGGSKMRMESVSGVEGQGISIMDYAGETMYVISPDERTYLEFPFGGGSEEGEMDDLLAGENPCTDYRVSRKEGEQNLNGRKTVKWTCSEPEDDFDAETTTFWIDRELKLPLRTEDSDGYISEITEFKPGPQPMHLFEVPAGYEKISMPFPFSGAAPPAESTSGEPFAPKPEIPTNPPDDEAKKAEFDLEIMMLRSLHVPPGKEVGIPAYPGAKALKFTPAGKGSINDEPFVNLPVIELITADDPKTVVEWYRKNLPGWVEKEFILNTYFWEGGDFHPLKVSGMETPYVGVFEIPRRVLSYFCMPDANTTIQIRYRPRN